MKRPMLTLLVALCGFAHAQPPMPTTPEIYGLTPAIWSKIVSKTYATRLAGRQQLKNASRDYLIDEFKSLYHWGWELLQDNLDFWIDFYGDSSQPNFVADAHLDIRSHLIDVKAHVVTLTNDCTAFEYTLKGALHSRVITSRCLRNFGCPLGIPVGLVKDPKPPVLPPNADVAPPLEPWNGGTGFDPDQHPSGRRLDADCVYGYMPPAN